MSVIYVRDLEGNEYLLQATVKHELDLNGNQQLSFTVLPTKTNNLFIDDIAEMWEIVDDDDVEHKIVYCKKKGDGDRLYVDVKAIPLFFDKFDTDRIYEEYNESMTAAEYFNLVFGGSDYNYVLLGTFSANSWQGLGAGDTRLAMFKDGLNRYKSEFYMDGNTIYLDNQIGRDTQFMYRYRLNASNIVKEIDASKLYTYAKGFGDFSEGDEQNAALIREYTSPLASVIGVRHAPPIYNGNITTAATMDEQLKFLVDESLKISVSATIHDLRKQGYALAQPELGDRVFLIDERIGLDEEVRVQRIVITKDWKGNVLDLSLTLGSPGITKRHQSNLQTALKNINRLLEGNLKIPYSAVDDAILIATEALRDAETELSFNDNGILATSKDNPNNVVLFNSAGIGVSTDGGGTFTTAMTANGFVADLVTVGTMLADRIKGGTLTLGGDVNGRMQVLNDNGEVIGDLSASLGGFASLYVADFDAPNVITKTTQNITYYVGEHVNNNYSPSDSADGSSWANALASIGEAIRRTPKHIDHVVTINLSSEAELRESIDISGLTGPGQFIMTGSAVIKGRINVHSSICRVIMKDFRCEQPNASENINTYNSSRVHVENVVARGGSSVNFQCYFGNLVLNNCEGYDSPYDVARAREGGTLIITNLKGLGARYGLLAELGSHIFAKNGTIPAGDAAHNASWDMGQLHIDTGTTVDYGSAPPPPPSETTSTWSATSANNWGTMYGWNDDNLVKQGNYGYGRRTGFWFFGTDPSSTLTGKTIKSMKVYVKRSNSGGSSGKVKANIRWHTYTSKPGGNPSDTSLSDDVATIDLGWGEGAWVTLPSSFYDDFQSGTAKGIGLYIASDNSANYMVFEPSAQLQVTYEV